MTELSPDERADESRCIARVVFIVGFVLSLCGYDDAALGAFAVASLFWLSSLA